MKISRPSCDSSGGFASLVSNRLLPGALLGLGLFYACANSSDPETYDEQVGVALETSAECALSFSADFVTEAKGLRDAIKEWSQDPEDEKLLHEAHVAYEKAMASWQEAELTQFGPAGKSGSVDKGGVVGGQDLRDQIYSWKLVNSCRVDQALVEKTYEDDLDAEAANARGLDVIEYLLYYDKAESTCPSTASIIEDGTWDELDDLAQRRAKYALAAAEDVLDSAQTLQNAWDEDGEDFSSSLSDAGQDGPYPSQAAALDDVVEGLIYVYAVVKDLKLGVPLGIHPDCSSETCPDELEHEWAGIGRASISANIDGFESLYRGCGGDDAFGFDDLLIEKGGQDVADDIDAALEDIRRALSDVPDNDLGKVLEDEPKLLEELYDAIEALTDILEGDFVDVLDANLKSVDGDND